MVLNGATGGVLTQFPTIQITDPTSQVLQPDMITDSAGNPGVATLSPAGRAEIERRRDLILGGTGFNRNPQFVDPDMQLPYHWAWSVGVTRQLLDNAALTVNYVGNASRDQLYGPAHPQHPDRRRAAKRGCVGSSGGVRSGGGAWHELPPRPSLGDVSGR